ncbi:hypothetical protein FEM48_Zijuj09G0226000 [Ziziphus jujuba var. spinosa]|nr:hypothetical protein FEM48_Zijuj09G0226000 [Ziziphus jujuba var. spinosa]
MISVYLLRRSGLKLRDHFFIFLHDMVMMVLMVSGCAAATAIGYVAKHGQEDMTWHSICGYVHKFCHKMIISMVFSYLTFFAYLALTIISAHGLAFPSPSTSTSGH